VFCLLGRVVWIFAGNAIELHLHNPISQTNLFQRPLFLLKLQTWKFHPRDLLDRTLSFVLKKLIKWISSRFLMTTNSCPGEKVKFWVLPKTSGL
jgi:hypothetical protein